MKIKLWHIVFFIFTAIVFVGLLFPGIISKAASVSEEMNINLLYVTDSAKESGQTKESRQKTDNSSVSPSDAKKAKSAGCQNISRSFEHIY